MRFAWVSLGLVAAIAACGTTTKTQPRNAAECRAAASNYAGLSFASQSAQEEYFSKVVTKVIDSDPTLRFIYLECLNHVGELPAGVSFTKESAAIPTAERSRYGSNVLVGGAGYRTDPFVTKTPQPTVYTRTEISTNNTGLELPTQYALLPGDEALWKTMSLSQQTRAMSFLASGSTIASSLQGDP